MIKNKPYIMFYINNNKMEVVKLSDLNDLLEINNILAASLEKINIIETNLEGIKINTKSNDGVAANGSGCESWKQRFEKLMSLINSCNFGIKQISQVIYLGKCESNVSNTSGTSNAEEKIMYDQNTRSFKDILSYVNGQIDEVERSLDRLLSEFNVSKEIGDFDFSYDITEFNNKILEPSENKSLGDYLSLILEKADCFIKKVEFLQSITCGG